MTINMTMKNQNTTTTTKVNTMISYIKKPQQLLSRALLMLVMSVLMSTSYAVEEITYYHNDALGSPVAASDEAGNVKWREEYLPYGERLLKEDNGTNDTWFTGKQEDKSNGLSYFGARWYDPVLGRFTGIDPVGFQEGNIQSFNRYAYANNNPYKYVDPDGRMTFNAGLKRGYTTDKAVQEGAMAKSVLPIATAGALGTFVPAAGLLASKIITTANKGLEHAETIITIMGLANSFSGTDVKAPVPPDIEPKSRIENQLKNPRKGKLSIINKLQSAVMGVFVSKQVTDNQQSKKSE